MFLSLIELIKSLMFFTASYSNNNIGTEATDTE